MRAGRLTLRLIACWLALVAFPLALPQAQAHPHIFIVQRVTVVFDEMGLAGIRVRWKFDDMFAGMIAEDFDLNRNGRLDPEEVIAVHADAFAYIAAYSYFTFITIDNQPFEVSAITDFDAVLENGGLFYEFFIPCRVPAAKHLRAVSVASYDPSYYTALFFAEKSPVTLMGADGHEVHTAIRQDPDTKIYYDMIHPWSLFMEFRKPS